jgi:TetR/AcrR family transcriptional regulator, transcriptional repressor for nem operon
MGRTKEFIEAEALAKARDVFWQHGYEATSLTDLTEGMQIQRASLYNTFGSKAELYAKTLLQYQDEGYANIERVLESAENPVESIRQLLYLTIPQSGIPCTKSRKGCFCVNAAVEIGASDPVLSASLERYFDKVRARIGKTIAAGQARGVFSLSLSPLEAGGYLLSCINGLQVTAKTTRNPDAMRQQAEMMLCALLA